MPELDDTLEMLFPQRWIDRKERNILRLIEQYKDAKKQYGGKTINRGNRDKIRRREESIERKKKELYAILRATHEQNYELKIAYLQFRFGDLDFKDVKQVADMYKGDLG